MDGETLAERLKRGPLPLEQALSVARQVAEALEEAHERGIIHRDLKPANVKVTPAGTVKLLAFGLAKALEGEPGAVTAHDFSQSPTLAGIGTQAGMILGTAAYMSPEQARGHKADRRSDVWSFGAVLYEPLTGRQAFAGETVRRLRRLAGRAALRGLPGGPGRGACRAPARHARDALVRGPRAGDVGRAPLNARGVPGAGRRSAPAKLGAS